MKSEYLFFGAKRRANHFARAASFASRRSQVERLEERALLSITPADYAAICERYSDLDLQSDLSTVNAIELVEWTAQALQNAVDEAARTPEPDLVAIDGARFDSPTLKLDGATITVNIPFETSGSLTFVAIGAVRPEISLDGATLAFDVFESVVQFGGFDFVDVAARDAVYRLTSSLASNVEIASWNVQDVRYFASDGSDISAQFDSDHEIQANLAKIDAYFAAKNEAFEIGVVPDANETNVAPARSNDYVLIFIGGGGARQTYKRYYETLVDFYATLTTNLNILPENIYILYGEKILESNLEYPSTSTSTSTPTSTTSTDDANETTTYFYHNVGTYDAPEYTISDPTFATSRNSTFVEATLANLWYKTQEIAAKMTSSSHLLVYTYDHGWGKTPEDCQAYATDTEDYLLDGQGYGISGPAFRDCVYQVKRGYVTFAFGQCFSGGILDDIFDPATGALITSYVNKINNAPSKYQGNAHFYGMSSTNHYEESWTGTYSDGTYAGFIQSFAEGLSRNITTEVFDYAIKDCYYSAKNETYANNEGTYANVLEHPWAAGETFSIFSTDWAVSTSDAALRALEAASDGETITFSENLSGQTITLTESQTISRSITIDASELNEPVTIDGGAKSRLFTFKSSTSEQIAVVVKNVIFSGGNGADASKSGNGGAVMIYPTANVTIEDSTFINSSASGFGGFVLNGGALILDNCSFGADEETTTLPLATVGGAIFNNGVLTVKNSTFVNCVSSRNGGAISNNSSSKTTSLIVENTIFRNCEAPNGGAIANYGVAEIIGGSFKNNLATASDGGGGAIANGATGVLTMRNVRLETNTAQYGGALGTQGTTIIYACEFSQNTASKNGGAISASNGSTTAFCADENNVASTLKGNTASGYGGAVANRASLTIADPSLVITGNTAAYGGGVSTSVRLETATDAYLKSISENSSTNSNDYANFYDYSVPENSSVSNERLTVVAPTPDSVVWIAVGESDKFVPLEQTATPNSLGVAVGKNAARLKFVDANGLESDVVSTTLIVAAPTPTFSVSVVELTSEIVRVELASNVPIAEWSLDWGDGTIETRRELATSAVFVRRFNDDATNCILALTVRAANASDANETETLAVFRPKPIQEIVENETDAQSSNALLASVETDDAENYATFFDFANSFRRRRQTRRFDALDKIFATLLTDVLDETTTENKIQ